MMCGLLCWPAAPRAPILQRLMHGSDPVEPRGAACVLTAEHGRASSQGLSPRKLRATAQTDITALAPPGQRDRRPHCAPGLFSATPGKGSGQERRLFVVLLMLWIYPPPSPSDLCPCPSPQPINPGTREREERRPHAVRGWQP